MKLVIMTKSTFFVEEDKILATLFEEGMDRLHLYKPNSSALYSERLLSLIPDNFHERIVVHNHFQLGNEYHLAGIHLDSSSVQPPRKVKDKIGRTCEDLAFLKEMKKNANYVFLRRIFPHPDNKNKSASFTREELEKAAECGLIDKKVYALGGVDLDHIRQARDLGFGGVVVCSDLWNRFDIHNATDYRALISHFRQLQRATS